MEGTRTLYTPEDQAKRLSLTSEQKEVARQIILSIPGVPSEYLREVAEDIIVALENGNPLNRIISDPEGEIIGFIVCRDLEPHSALVMCLAINQQTGRNLIQELQAFLEYAKKIGYKALTFEGWNPRLNNILERRYKFHHYRDNKLGKDKKYNVGVF